MGLEYPKNNTTLNRITGRSSPPLVQGYKHFGKYKETGSRLSESDP